MTTAFQISWTKNDDFQIDEKFIHNCLPCLIAEMAKVASSVAAGLENVIQTTWSGEYNVIQGVTQPVRLLETLFSALKFY